MKRTINRITFSSQFAKKFCALPEQVQMLARKKDQLFRTDAFDPSLETHKLGGEFKDCWSYSVKRTYRVLFCFMDDHTVTYLNIGTHEIYK